MKFNAIMLVVLMSLGIFIFCGNFVFAQKEVSAPQLFYKANEFFEKGQYSQAESAYKQIIDSGISSGNIYYNLGNVYFKQGRIGKAIVNYERAAKLLPQDSDVKANLEYACSLCNNPVVSERKNWVIGIVRNVSGYFTLDNWTRILSAIYILLLMVLSGFVVLKAPFFKKIAFFLAGGLFLTVWVWSVKFYDADIVKKAIVIKQETDSRFAPSKDAVVHFKTFEGAKIQVIDKNNSWFRVKTPDGKIGWVLQSDIEII